jgi:hypothetical protein
VVRAVAGRDRVTRGHLPAGSAVARAVGEGPRGRGAGGEGVLREPGDAGGGGPRRGQVESWQKWSFPFRPHSQHSAGPADWRPVRERRRISRFSSAGGPMVALAGGWAMSRGAGWSSPRSAPAAGTGGRWGSRRPAPPICSAANSRPPSRSCSPRPCRAACNPARMNPAPMRSG